MLSSNVREAEMGPFSSSSRYPVRGSSGGNVFVQLCPRGIGSTVPRHCPHLGADKASSQMGDVVVTLVVPDMDALGVGGRIRDSLRRLPLTGAIQPSWCMEFLKD